MSHKYADIPESRTKMFYGIGKHIWNIYKELGYEYITKFQEVFADMIVPESKGRLNTTILTAKDIIQGKLTAGKTLSYMIFPPVVTHRGDLTQGNMKLLYGETCDITFVVFSDISKEILILLNGHCEDGVPVDWWIEQPDSEILDRRHQKLGFKLRELPIKIKDLTRCGHRIIEILKNVRNERTPQWNLSSYHISMVWSSGLLNQLIERSTWEGFAEIWDGVNSRKFGLPDYWFCYVPWPNMVRILFNLSRRSWTLKLTGLMLGHKYYLQSLENISINWLRENFPEIFKISLKRQIEDVGIPLPRQTLESDPPNIKDKNIIENELFDFKYPNPEQFLKASDLDMTIDDILKGVYLDVSHETKEKISKKHIISKGIGRNTVYLK